MRAEVVASDQVGATARGRIAGGTVGHLRFARKAIQDLHVPLHALAVAAKHFHDVAVLLAIATLVAFSSHELLKEGRQSSP